MPPWVELPHPEGGRCTLDLIVGAADDLGMDAPAACEATLVYQQEHPASLGLPTRVHIAASNALLRSGFERAAHACNMSVVDDIADAALIVTTEPGPADGTIARLMIDEHGLHLDAPLETPDQTLLDAARLSTQLIHTI